ncbi:MAG: GNAT family N-acetyltransferase [Verrucomicrobia bacterium]|nr:GNAT family N-acetyltransferase [Verrucomicrobiota bacterium]MDA1068444.1 GNAT family N-acetyltransferase [Verrucomicrobiota bacterium]
MKLSLTSSFDFQSKEYRTLLQNSQVSAFQQPDWLSTLYKHIADDSVFKPLVVQGRSSQTNELQIIIPIFARTDGDEVVVEYASAGVTDYACPIVSTDLLKNSDQLAGFPDQLFEVLKDYKRLRIGPVKEEDLSLWRQLLGTAPTKAKFGRHAVVPGSPYKEWRNSNLGKSRRSQLDRKARRLADRGKVHLQVLPSSEAGEALNWAKQTRTGRFQNDAIQREYINNFYSEIAARGTATGFARTYKLTCGEDPVATCFGVVDGDRYCYLVLACDYENFAQYSPGMMVLDLAMADWAATGGKVFDFTIGDEPFKSSFGCTRSPMFTFEADIKPS